MIDAEENQTSEAQKTKPTVGAADQSSCQQNHLRNNSGTVLIRGVFSSFNCCYFDSAQISSLRFPFLQKKMGHKIRKILDFPVLCIFPTHKSWISQADIGQTNTS